MSVAAPVDGQPIKVDRFGMPAPRPWVEDFLELCRLPAVARADVVDLWRAGSPRRAGLRALEWVVAAPLLLLLKLYQLTASRLIGSVCRFHPSCSRYSFAALASHGPLGGSWLTMRRLGRCHPWAAGGIDHVPPRSDRSTLLGDDRKVTVR